MDIKQKTYVLDTLDFYKKNIEIINILKPVKDKLTQGEIDVLAEFCATSPELQSGDMFNPLIRKNIQKKWDMSPGSLSNFLRNLRDKGAIHKNSITNVITLDKLYVFDGKAVGYQLKIENYDSKN